MSGWKLAWRVALLLVITAVGVLIGLWAAPKNVTGCTRFGCRNQFPSWFWPVTCIGGLSLIWLYAAWSLVIGPIRMELRYGVPRNRAASSRTSMDGIPPNREAASLMSAQGWYKDPFGAHEARWISGGKPTRLVRDGAVESHDDPPEAELELPLVPLSEHHAEDSTDLMRAGSSEPTSPPGDGAFQAFGSSGGSFT